ncbi:putative sulfate exporter family transporter [uncultured Nocardioides sp.]|uniref:YeiH family protein n=1 Tax=uncultured Nocardioides sp. TaxID=198441 RepID=UPI0030F5D3D9
MPTLVRRLPPLGVALAAALAAVAVSGLVPLLGALLVALALGTVVANTPLAHARALVGHAAVTKLLLRLGVVLLGLRLPLGDVAAIGAAGVLVVVATVVLTYAATRALGTHLGLDQRLVTLLAAGFSICGAAAIAALADAVGARQKDVAHSVALVTIYGTAMIVVVPWAAAGLGLSEEQGAIWAGASIHEVAQVVAAASIIGPGAVAVATTVKLGRVALLAPTYLVAVRGVGAPASAGRVPLLPWFLVGFVVMVALRSSDLLPGQLVGAADDVTTVLLAAGMFGLGLGLRMRELWPVPAGALVLATCSTLVAAGTSLALVVALY